MAHEVLSWYRSWPKHESAGPSRDHPRVIDHLPRILIDQYDYTTAETVWPNGRITGLPDERLGFCLLEWDVALESAERIRFARMAAKHPHDVLVAPYNLYPIDGNPECAHRRIDGTPIDAGAERCDTFGLGCIFIPRSVLNGFMAQLSDIGMTDASFSRYVYHHHGPTFVAWSFHPQHLSGD